MVMLIPNIAIFSNAVEAEQAEVSEPLLIEVTTDKSSYTAYGIARITVKVTNTSDEAINNISAEAVFEQLAPVGKNNETFKEVESLQPDESFEFSYKATVNSSKVNINFFEIILLWFTRLFNGGYTATSHDIEADIENITEIKFGKYTVQNVVRVGHDEIVNNNADYNELIQDVNVDEVYQHNSENLIEDEESGIKFTNNIIIIMFDWDCTEQRKANIINSINGKVVGGITGYNELHIEIEESTLEELEEICDKLNENEDIYATYDTVSYTSSVSKVPPNDPWGITDDNEDINWENAFDSSYTWSAVAIDAPGAWLYNAYFNNINIGIVDSGFSTQNKDLNLRVVSTENSPDDHGTKVAGIIGATPNNKTGISGIVWNKNILAYDAENASGMHESDIYKGIETLVKKNCKVINLSIGSPEALNDKQIKREGKTASKKMAQLLEKGYDFIIVQAAGNGDSNNIGFDAIKNGDFCSITNDNCYSNKKISKEDIMNRIIIVANAMRDFDTNSFVCAQNSNGGNQVHIAAPGANILSTSISTEFPYDIDSGTSMAAPFVTGVASLVWSVNFDFTGKEVRQIVLDTAKKGNIIVADNKNSPTTGNFYMVNAKLAVEEAINRTNIKIIGNVKDSSTNKAIDKLVTIKVLNGDNTVINNTKADINGAFSINVPAGNYTILIECEGYVPNRSYVTVGNSNENIGLGTILLKSNSSSENNTSSVHGTVKDEKTGNAISGVRVEFIDNSTDNFDTVATATTGADGSFSVELPYGSYSMSFNHDDYEYYGESIEVDFENIELAEPILLTPKNSSGDGSETIDPNRTVIYSGDCGADGDNVKWVLYDDGELVISGTGKMADYSQENTSPPWGMCKSRIKSINIKNGVTSVSDEAFDYCTSLNSVTIGNSVVSIGVSAFEHCEYLRTVIIGNGVTSIGSDAFNYCISLTNITIPNSVTSIGSGAFSYCTSLTSVIIPDSVMSLSINAFDICKNLESITVDPNNLNYSSYEGVLFNKLKTELIRYPMGSKRTNYTIPNSVLKIGYYAFGNCHNLTSIIIPDSVTTIDENAFFQCDNLISITIPYGVTSIGYNTFKYCKNLTSITIPDSVNSIGDSAFQDCINLTEIKIPDGVTIIGAVAFSGCSSLVSITIPKSITKIKEYAFDDCDKLANVYYTGSEQDWRKITISDWGNGNKNLTNATIHCNS